MGEGGPESKCWLLEKKNKMRTTLSCHHRDISNAISKSFEIRGSTESQHVNEGSNGKALYLQEIGDIKEQEEYK